MTEDSSAKIIRKKKQRKADKYLGIFIYKAFTFLNVKHI